MESACRVYRPRDPRKTALWGLLDTLYERVKGSWEEATDAIQVTSNGGRNPIESVDGRSVYYTKNPATEPTSGIWRVPVGGGPEEPVIEFTSSVEGGWDLTAEGLFYVDQPDGPGSPWVVNRYDLKTRNVARVAQLPYTPSPAALALGVSPDGRWILSVEHSSDWDLMLVENFEQGRGRAWPPWATRPRRPRGRSVAGCAAVHLTTLPAIGST